MGATKRISELILVNYQNNNLITNLSNKKNKQSVNGNTNTVYINPLNSLNPPPLNP